MIEVSTLSGSASLGDNSQQMGNRTDAALLQALRGWADAVVVGTGTIRAENYGGISPTAQRPTPAPMVAITPSLSLDPDSKFFTSASTAPLIAAPSDSLTNPAHAARIESYRAAGAEVIDTGAGGITELLAALRHRGLYKIVCEGGPGIYSRFIAEGCVDQLYLTLDPHLTAHVERPLVFARENSPAGAPHRMHLEQVTPDTDSTVFLRYGRGRS